MKYFKYILFSLFVLSGCGSINGNPYEVINLGAGIEVYDYKIPLCSNYGIYATNDFGNTIDVVVDAYNTILDKDSFLQVIDIIDSQEVKGIIEIKSVDIISDRPSAAGQAIGPRMNKSGQCYCEILIQNNSKNSWNVLAHEIGHCLGFDHNNDSRSLMYGTAGGSFTQEFVDILQQQLKDL